MRYNEEYLHAVFDHLHELERTDYRENMVEGVPQGD